MLTDFALHIPFETIRVCVCYPNELQDCFHRCVLTDFALHFILKLLECVCVCVLHQQAAAPVSLRNV